MSRELMLPRETMSPALPPEPTDAPTAGPLPDLLAEARRLIDAARDQGITLRALGGVAVHMRCPDDTPVLGRELKDIDLVAPRGEGKVVGQLLGQLDYVGEEMFNALRGSRRQLFHDLVNQRQLDIFIGEFAMCHAVPIAERLDQHPYTVPLAELLLTKLQIVELNERDERDIYTLCFHHPMGELEADVVAELCAADWGLWRTCQGTLQRCQTDLGAYELTPDARAVIEGRLQGLTDALEAAPKSRKWKRRSRVGERMRWYQEPEEV
jgi:hypothetical protein